MEEKDIVGRLIKNDTLFNDIYLCKFFDMKMQEQISIYYKM